MEAGSRCVGRRKRVGRGSHTVDVDLVAGDGRALAVDCGHDFGFEVL